jgi:hypothetical protein
VQLANFEMLYTTLISTRDTVQQTKEKVIAEDGNHITENPAPFIGRKYCKIIRNTGTWTLKFHCCLWVI